MRKKSGLERFGWEFFQGKLVLWVRPWHSQNPEGLLPHPPVASLNVDIKRIIAHQLQQPGNSPSLEESSVFSKNHLQASPHNGLNTLFVQATQKINHISAQNKELLPDQLADNTQWGKRPGIGKMRSQVGLYQTQFKERWAFPNLHPELPRESHIFHN